MGRMEKSPAVWKPSAARLRHRHHTASPESAGRGAPEPTAEVLRDTMAQQWPSF
jgi:hypothetical protein